MNTKKLISVALAATFLASAAAANTTTVRCTGYIIALTEEVVTKGESMIGSRSGFETEVCRRSAPLAEGLYEEQNPHRVQVSIDELGMNSYVVIFSTEEEPSNDE